MLSKAFDVSAEQFPPASQEEALVSKYLSVDIKELERRTTRVMSVRMGKFLTAIDEELAGREMTGRKPDQWLVDDVRNLDRRGMETPPVYDTIQLNSSTESDFLIDGMRFMRHDDGQRSIRATLRVEPRWYGLDVTAYGVRSLGTAGHLLSQIHSRASEINFLKGEAFSLSGEFLPKTAETFADLFLEPANAAAVQRIVRLINERGKSLDNRGVILMGPPGTGKTLSARIVRNEAKATFIWVSARDFHYSGSFGGFTEAFDLARECAPSVIVFEDVDNWLYDTTIDLLKTEMDGVARNSGVVTMMTTNFPELLPAALIDRPGRFHDVLKFDLPNESARKQMLTRWLPDVASSDIDAATKATDGYSGAHLKELARFAGIISEQEGLAIGKALIVALKKLADQRELIAATQRRGSHYRAPSNLVAKMAVRISRSDVPLLESLAKAACYSDRLASSTLHIKGIDEEQRVITGIATTPSPDRVGDVIEPKGIKFGSSVKLLLHHDKTKPVGNVVFEQPTNEGVKFTARIAKVEEPGLLKDRVDEAWHSVKARVLDTVSIGFRVLDDAVERIKDGGYRFLKTELLELSLVAVPANADAVITGFKSLHQAASGRSQSPGGSGLPVVTALKDAPKMKTTAEQIQAFENTRAVKAARMTDLMTKASETGVTLDPAQAEEYDTLKLEIRSIDEHLARLRELEKMTVAAATPIAGVRTIEAASSARGGTSVVQVKSVLPKGTAFVRFAMAKVMGKGSMADAIAYAESRQDWKDQTPEVLLALKAAVNPGTVAEPAWAAPLAVTRPMQEEWLELLRPMTLIGQITGLRRVPFNISIPVQTGGGTYAWVGEGAPKPVGNLQFSSATLPIAKSAGIIVISEELAKIANPSAEGVVRNDMLKGMSQFLDQQFIDPTVAAVANVSPASITNLANGYATAGTSGDNARTDVKKGVQLLTAGNYSIAELVFIMSESNAFAIAAALTANGQPLFPGMTMKGGNMFGVPVFTSQSAGSVVATVHTPSILFADDGGVNIDVSREASVEMNTAPTSPVAAATVLVSLWQQNLVGLRAERFINWKRVARPGVQPVVYTTAAYV